LEKTLNVRREWEGLKDEIEKFEEKFEKDLQIQK
jgi:hypothetical protein